MVFKKGEVREAAHKMIRTASSAANMVKACFLVPYAWTAFKKRVEGGGALGQPPICKQHGPHSFPLLQPWW